ncbi:MAG: hypothetical protein IJ019_04355 [Alphaproteobacteria bacterium]|nr:hypothetical protein [Alphaproteobacteria bacterium]
MRKYFLLSAVALMISGTANARTTFDYMNVSANLIGAEEMTCSDLTFGDIIIKNENKESTIEAGVGWFETTGDIIQVTGYEAGYCNEAYYPTLESDTITLKGPDSTTLTITGVYPEDGYISGTLNIPANVTKGEYSANILVLGTYE